MNYRQNRKVRNRVYGDSKRPRLSVFRSNKHLYAQIIDDGNGKTLLSICDVKTKANKKKSEKAEIIGKELAQKLKKKNIEKVVFDRSGYKYHGRIKALAEEVRKADIDL